METGNWFAGCAYNDEGELHIAEGEPEYQYDGVTYKYDSDSESYVGEDGNVMTSDEWEEVAQSYPYNPFDDFDTPWE